MPDFEITDEGILKKYNGHEEHVIIPEHLIYIGTHAFYNCDFIKSITFPDSVIHIWKSAFQGCRNLEEVILPEYLADIGEGAFCQCQNLKKITFPRRLEKIGKDAFLGCVSLEQAVLPDSVSELGQGAFQGCEKLKSVRLPKHLTELKSYLFSYCASLTEIEIPETVTKIGTQTFWNCQGLSEIHLPDGLEFISNDVIYDYQRPRCYFTYRGIRFSGSRDAGTCVYMIANHNFHVNVPITKKAWIISQMYQQNPTEENLLQYLKEEFPNHIKTMIEENQTNTLRQILDIGQMIQKENIDELIRYAIDKKSYETQIMLTDYKRKQFGFESAEEKAKGLLLE